ncbi:hypothetical protein TrRE_jg2138 [Triparma retinervis]|uniref:ADP/ATP translocase n=1 Tax=Triparma retinervis TaxID=2557542 RepID=A0A9W7A414_9STRA|nr:hypothetical protein TrRE_jg2138 [Triparma retinervis]
MDAIFASAAAGAAAGALAKTVVAPIERVKLLLQLQSASNKHMKQIGTPYTSAMDAARRVYREQGFLSFWRGNVSNIIRHTGATAVTFTMKDRFREFFLPICEGENPNVMRRRKILLASFLSGGAAGATATTMFYPLEYTRTRLALDSGSGATRLYPGGLRDVIRRTVNVDGVAGLYKGYPVALFGIVLFRALSMGGYDFVKGEMEISNSAPLYRRFVAAQLVSVAAGTICYPIDTVRRKLMMQAGSKKKLYDSAQGCVKCIIETHGYRGFYNGLSPNIMRSVGGAILLVSYDEFKSSILSFRGG